MSLQQFDVTSAILQKDQPRRKKRYVLFLYTKSSPAMDVKTVERAVSSSLKEHTLVHLEDPDEALKLMALKNVELVVLDPCFLGEEGLTIEYALELKKRKKCPIFFIATNEEKLISHYRAGMSLYEELDDYVVSPVDFVEVTKRLHRLVLSSGRAAKRFQVGAPIVIYRLNTDKSLKGVLNDISLVGVGLLVEDDAQVSRNEQLQIKIPLGKFGIFHPTYGDYLKLSCRVQRLSIDGRTLGCSLEFLTDTQNVCLAAVIEQVAKKSRIFKNKQQAVKPKPAE